MRLYYSTSHLQYEDGDKKSSPVKAPSSAVDAIGLLLVHVAPTIPTATTASETHAN